MINKLACYSRRSSHIYHITICHLSSVQGHVIIIDTFCLMTFVDLQFLSITLYVECNQRPAPKGASERANR